MAGYRWVVDLVQFGRAGAVLLPGTVDQRLGPGWSSTLPVEEPPDLVMPAWVGPERSGWSDRLPELSIVADFVSDDSVSDVSGSVRMRLVVPSVRISRGEDGSRWTVLLSPEAACGPRSREGWS